MPAGVAPGRLSKWLVSAMTCVHALALGSGGRGQKAGRNRHEPCRNRHATDKKTAQPTRIRPPYSSSHGRGAQGPVVIELALAMTLATIIPTAVNASAASSAVTITASVE